MRHRPAAGLLLGGIGSVQFGSAFADTCSTRPARAASSCCGSLLSALILLAVARPSLRGRTRADLLRRAGLRARPRRDELEFYEALDRLPLGVAVTIEFTGPLVGRGRRIAAAARCASGSCSPPAGVVLLALRGEHHGMTRLGVVLALIAAACWAAYILLSKRVGSIVRRSWTGWRSRSASARCSTVPAGIVEGGAALLSAGRASAAASPSRCCPR